jgi:hypothetical protein
MFTRSVYATPYAMAMSGMSRTLALRSAEAPIVCPLSMEESAAATFRGGVGGDNGSTALIVALRGL